MFAGTLVLMTLASGCAALGALLPDVITYVTDGTAIIDTIASFLNTFFLAHPDPVAQAEVGRAIVKVRAALTTLLRTAQGAKALDDANVDAAFADFKSAYLELMVLARPFGVQPVGTGRTRATANTLEVPEPLAFHPKRSR